MLLKNPSEFLKHLKNKRLCSHRGARTASCGGKEELTPLLRIHVLISHR
jgi:hypothetical protein